MTNHVGRVLLVADESLSASEAQILGLVVRSLKVIPHSTSSRSRARLTSAGVVDIFVV